MPLAFPRTYALVWAITLTSALSVLLTPGLPAFVRDALDLTFTTDLSGITGLLTIWLRNAASCMIPVWLLLLVDPSRGGWRFVLPLALILLTFIPTLVIVGAAIGAYRFELLPYIVHLPFEWAAIAYPLSLWPAATSAPLPRALLAQAAFFTLILTFVGALIEVGVSL